MKGGPATPSASLTLPPSALGHSCRTVSQRADGALELVLNGSRNLLDIALNHLTLGRAALYTILEQSYVGSAKSELEQAVTGFRRAGMQDELPRGLLTRAWLRFLEGQCTGPSSAQEDLDEAWDIAERGSMRLFLADILLYRARLFFRTAEYPWKDAPDRAGNRTGNRTAKDDLADAEYWINHCGYHRRDEELADAKSVINGEAQST